MSRRVKWSSGIAAFACLAWLGVVGPVVENGAAARPKTLSGAANAFDNARAFEDLRSQVDIGPRESGSAGGRAEVAFIKRRLQEGGLTGVRVQSPWQNVVVRIPGKKSGTIVVGAHHDTKDGIPGFVGANDGASEVAVLLEMARVLPRPLPGPSVTLAFFDAEESRGSRSFSSDGIRGSKQFVRLARRSSNRQSSPALRGIGAMYLVDMVGDCNLRIPRERNSSTRLYNRMHGPTFGGTRGGILDDHIPFLNVGIDAVDLIDFTYGPGGSPGAWWHTPNDTIDKVCPGSLGKVGRSVIRALGTL